MNLARQPFLLALLTLLALVAAAFLRRQWMAFPVEVLAEPQTIAGQWLAGWQTEWPRTTRCLCGLLAVVSALMLGRIGVRYKLYGGGTLLAIPLYGVIACGIYLPAAPLVGFAASFLLALALRLYCASYRNGYTFDSLFRGSLCLGTIPLLYAPALPVALLLPVGTLLFKRTFRELIVALSGFLLPAAAASYLCWAFGGPIDGVALQLLGAGRPVAADWTPAGGSIVALLLAAVLVLIVLGTLFSYANDRYASSTKARAILTAGFWLLAAACAIPLLTGPSASCLPLIAVPASLLLPFLFARVSAAVANLLYALVLALTLLHLVF